jgi:hypothetical protein
MQNLQVRDTAETRIIPRWIFPPRFLDKNRLPSYCLSTYRYTEKGSSVLLVQYQVQKLAITRTGYASRNHGKLPNRQPTKLPWTKHYLCQTQRMTAVMTSSCISQSARQIVPPIPPWFLSRRSTQKSIPTSDRWLVLYSPLSHLTSYGVSPVNGRSMWHFCFCHTN